MGYCSAGYLLGLPSKGLPRNSMATCLAWASIQVMTSKRGINNRLKSAWLFAEALVHQVASSCIWRWCLTMKDYVSPHSCEERKELKDRSPVQMWHKNHSTFLYVTRSAMQWRIVGPRYESEVMIQMMSINYGFIMVLERLHFI
jgi:hypothetical protein